MADNKKAVIVYADWIDKFEELTDEEAGKLIKHFFRYVNDMNPEAPDRTTKLMFVDIKNSLKRDLEKWEKTLEGRSKAGKASAEKRRLAKLAQQEATNPTSVENVEKNPTNPTDSVSDSVSDIIYTEKEFIQRWTDAREHYLKKPYFKSKLEVLDKIKLDKISEIYTKNQIDNALKGMFTQKGILDHLLLQPTHFLELKNFEMYLTCSITKEQVYDKKGFKKTIDRI